MKFNVDVANLAYQNILDNATRFQLILFQGGRVTPAELAANFNQSATSPVLNNMATVITTVTSRGGKVVAVADVTRSLFPAMNTAPALNVGFQYSKVPLTVVNAGGPDWYLAITRNAAVAYSANGLCFFNITGTVSVYGGGGDMEVEDTEITLSSTKRVMNIRLRQGVTQ